MGYPMNEIPDIPDGKTLDRPMGSVKHPFVAWLLASARMLAFSFRHSGKPMRVDYNTGDVWKAGE